MNCAVHTDVPASAYCRNCGNVLHDAAFEPVDLGKQIKAMIAEFNGSEQLRTCKKCGEVFGVQ